MKDTQNLRKVCVSLSMNLMTGLDFVLGLSLFEIIDLIEDVKEMQKEAERQAKKR